MIRPIHLSGAINKEKIIGRQMRRRHVQRYLTSFLSPVRPVRPDAI